LLVWGLLLPAKENPSLGRLILLRLFFSFDDFQFVRASRLKAGKFPLKKVILFTTDGERHGWRIDAVEEDGLRVMEPMIGDFRKMTWEEFRSSGKALLKMD
jgi:hypothetical protein